METENTCKLCKTESELRFSHILPEFFYANIYDELHRTLKITGESEKIIQKGLREYLLCQKCEVELSRYEDYAANVIRNIPNFARDVNGRFLFSEKVNYSLFKLFQLSLLWRFSVSSNPAFSQTSLGHHEEIIRQMLYEKNPGESSEYGCVIMATLNTELLHKVISSPIKLKPKINGNTIYKLTTGNLTWVFFVASHPASRQIQEFFIHEKGLLKVWLTPDEKTSVLNIARNMQRLENLRLKS